MSNIVIKVENLSKQYRLGELGTGTISHDLNRWWHRVRGKEDPYLKVGEVNDRLTKGGSEYAWALRDINFEVGQGEVLGIIGKNGAGKSTLLKLLSRVTSPTTGVIKAKGRIASLLEVGTGFHEELTGRENIFLNGAILGMTKAEVRAKFDEIVAFSGTERYIDTPVKRYSSGMRVRLAFAVAAHLEPEILIVDEVLAVGDDEFQKKAIGKMKEVASGGDRTVLFVSHNMAAVQNLCTRGLVIANGEINFNGDINTAISLYLSNFGRNTSENLKNVIRKGNQVTKLISAEVYSMGSDNLKIAPTIGKDVYFEFIYNNELKKHRALEIDFRVDSNMGYRVGWLSTKMLKEITSIEKEKIVFKMQKCQLNYGTYIVTICTYVNGDVADWIQNAFSFDIEKGDFYNSGKLPPKEQTDFLMYFSV